MSLRLALIRQRYRPDGGAERFVSRAIEALEGEDIELTVIARSWERHGPARLLRCNPFHVGRLWRDRSFARCACRAVSAGGFDLVQSHERIPCAEVYRAGDGVHAVWLEQRARILSPWRAWSMRNNPYHRYLLHTEKTLLESPRLRAVICNSRMVRDEILARFSTPADRVHVIYNGVDTQRFHPRNRTHRERFRRTHGLPAAAPLLLFAGSGFERKGLSATLRALARAPSGMHLAVIGTDKHGRRYRALARSLGISERVHFLGRMEDMTTAYAAADALVLPTLYDPFPNVTLEAMASGLPVIVSQQAGTREIIEEGVNGYTCDALDLDHLAEHMAALADPALAEQMGQAARRTVEPMTLEAMNRALRALYARLLSETGRNHP
ncbi:MAG: glycosyltransferase family 1 protein [Gammaproteobacteria bacterium]|nr:MAG: glycosyltransferase family 1 protein [Gammaproteobacteria bacterium]